MSSISRSLQSVVIVLCNASKGQWQRVYIELMLQCSMAQGCS